MGHKIGHPALDFERIDVQLDGCIGDLSDDAP